MWDIEVFAVVECIPRILGIWETDVKEAEEEECKEEEDKEDKDEDEGATSEEVWITADW